MLVQRQLRYQPFQLAVLFLQFLHPLCLVHLQTAVFLPPAVERLDGDLGFLAGLWGGLSVRDAYFNLPQHRYDLLWLVPLDWHDQLFLQVDSLSFHLVQILPVTSAFAGTLKYAANYPTIGSKETHHSNKSLNFDFYTTPSPGRLQYALTSEHED